MSALGWMTCRPEINGRDPGWPVPIGRRLGCSSRIRLTFHGERHQARKQRRSLRRTRRSRIRTAAHRGNSSRRRLLMAVRDAALRQVIWRHLHGDPVAVHDFDTVSPESSGHRREDGFSDIELDREHSSFELLDHLAHYFDCIFFWQLFPLSANKNWAWQVLSHARIPNPGLTSGFVASRRRSRDIRRRPMRVRPLGELR